MNISYTKRGDYYFPNLVAPESEKDFKISKYGRLRLKYLKENKYAIYTIMLMNNELQKHLIETDIIANERYELIVKQLAEKENITEELKSKDQLKWVGMMNNIKHCAEEIVLKKIIYD